MEFFEAGKMYVFRLPGEEGRTMLFDCQAIVVNPGSGKPFATGFTSHEGSGFWRDIPVQYRDIHGWELYDDPSKPEIQPFFEPGLYEFRPDNGNSVGAEFLCAGVVGHPYFGINIAVGYWRRLRASGKIGDWELRSKASVRDWYPANPKK